jgi:hypothetical protein
MNARGAIVEDRKVLKWMCEEIVVAVAVVVGARRGDQLKPRYANLRLRIPLGWCHASPILYVMNRQAIDYLSI